MHTRYDGNSSGHALRGSRSLTEAYYVHAAVNADEKRQLSSLDAQQNLTQNVLQIPYSHHSLAF
eukprot:930356-Pelagomonas_calceolata.AAC.2